MVIAYPPAMFSEVLDFLVTSPTPDDILAFKPSQEQENQFEALMTKNKQSTLTKTEQDELESFLQLNHFVNMLKIRARQKLATS
ncbi:MAG: hypothetical protein WBC91_14530 [Phototrophicaceae bacterium]